MDGDEREGAAEIANAGDPPKFFKNINAWIGGVTGVVLALAGLRAAYQQFMPEQRAPADQVALVNEAQAVPTAETSSEPAAAAPTGSQEQQSPLPLAYTGDGYEMRWKDGAWVETDTDGNVARYDEQARDSANTFVIDRANKVRWRWPTGGGRVSYFDDGKQEWIDSEIVYSVVTG